MRILITGFVVFVIWCVISAWLYNDKLLPAMKKPVPVQTIPDSQTSVADSLTRLKASMPKSLLVYFEFNDAKFKPDPQTGSSLAPFKSWLDKYTGSMLYVTGHTDLVGTDEFNQALGLKRAQVVAKFLESQGIPTGKIVSESKGESQPAADYLTEEGRAKNRRTEISIKMP
jgi:outer membrane protein OmpA-like peptidoglycan-associated protein